ncbi:MAG: hypothetical protein WBA57_11650 [Elainellaceae cyanobacterium]
MTLDHEVLKPVYIVVVASTLLAVAWGLIFKDMLEYQVNSWYANRASQPEVYYQKPVIVFTYTVLTLFVSICVASSLTVFGFSILWASVIGGVIVVPTAALIWFQLGSMLKLLVFGGSEAVDIDSYGAGQKFDAQAAPPKS